MVVLFHVNRETGPDTVSCQSDKRSPGYEALNAVDDEMTVRGVSLSRYNKVQVLSLAFL